MVPEPEATLELNTTGVPEHVAKLPDCTLTTGVVGIVPVVTVIALLGKLGQLLILRTVYTPGMVVGTT